MENSAEAVERAAFSSRAQAQDELAHQMAPSGLASGGRISAR